MPITKSAKKALRVSERKMVINLKRKIKVKKAVKSFETAVAKGAEDVAASLKTAYSELDRAAKRGVLHKKTAARKKSRLAKKLNAATKK